MECALSEQTKNNFRRIVIREKVGGILFFCGPSKLILDSVPVVSKSRMF